MIYTGYDNELVLPDTMAQQLRRMPGVAHVWGCTGLVHVPASSDRNNVEQVTFCSYDDFMLESSKSMVVKGRMAKNSGADNEVMTMYNKTNPIRVGDTITVNGVPLTVVGAFSQGIFPDDVTIIAPEVLFRRVAGEQNYNMIGVQLDRTASDETVLELAVFSSDQIVVQDLRESNRQDRGTYYAARIVLYGFLAIIGSISLLNIINSISMSVSARMKQYGILRAIGMDDAQLKRMISAEAGLCGVRSCGGHCAGSCAESDAVYPAHHPLFRCGVAGTVGLSCRDCRSRAGGCGAGSIYPGQANPHAAHYCNHQ